MKKAAVLLAAFVLLNLLWMGFVRQPLPPRPEICAERSDNVKFNFAINTMDLSGVELSLNDKFDGKGMYVQFKMGNAWKNGRTGLVLQGIKANSNFRNGMSPRDYLENPGRRGQGGKDFSSFMQDNRGKSVTTYTFQQQLVEGSGGQTFLKMSYDGPAMEMIQSLEIPHPVTVPAHISRQFIPEGIIQFQPGTVGFDNSIRGFYIPVVVR